MHELDLHALLSQLIVTLACQLLAMLTVNETQQPWRQRYPQQQHLRPRWAPWERQRKWQVKRIICLTGQLLLCKAVSISQDVHQLFVKSSKNHLKRADELWSEPGEVSSNYCRYYCRANLLWKHTYSPQDTLLSAHFPARHTGKSQKMCLIHWGHLSHFLVKMRCNSIKVNK